MKILQPRRSAATVLVVLVALPPLLACGGGLDGPAPEGAVEEGRPVPAFQLASLDGNLVGPAAHEGDVLLFEFWATWCPPCHEQAAILRPLAAEFEARGVRFFAVDVGEPEETVRSFVTRNPFPYPVLIDPEDELSWELGINALPTLLVVDRKGTVSYFRPGVLEADGIRRVLAQAGVA